MSAFLTEREREILKSKSKTYVLYIDTEIFLLPLSHVQMSSVHTAQELSHGEPKCAA